MAIIPLILLIFFTGCTKPKEEAQKESSDHKAQEIVDRSIEVHGGELFWQSKISFTFRGKRHFVFQNDSSFLYERSFEEGGDHIKDRYQNGVISREVNGTAMRLSGRQKSDNTRDLNSVSYFALLPYKLNDQAVIKNYLGVIRIKGRTYDKIQVTFRNEGGGASPDNVFIYWFDQETGLLTYLGYTKEGNRFRAAYNHRIVNGIHFADYVNYKSESVREPDIESYDVLFEKGDLKELSRIILEDVDVVR